VAVRADASCNIGHTGKTRMLRLTGLRRSCP
jgi:hypothetical protein